MKKLTVLLSGFIALGFAFATQAQTIEVESTAHWVTIDEGLAFETPSGAKGMYAARSHATVISKDGSLMSQWCTQEIGHNDEGQTTGFAGYCTVLADNGDVMWVSFLGTPTSGVRWTVMGGTGQNQGATGGGTSEMVSMRADGEAWTTKSKGTITIPDAE